VAWWLARRARAPPTGRVGGAWPPGWRRRACPAYRASTPGRSPRLSGNYCFLGGLLTNSAVDPDPDPIQWGPWIRIANPDPDPGGNTLPTNIEINKFPVHTGNG
jgi:hypothetical protein